MDNFTKKRFKKPKEFIEGITNGDLSLRKREFDLNKSLKTVRELSEDGKLLKSKVEELKEAHERLLHPDPEEKREFIDRQKGKKRK